MKGKERDLKLAIKMRETFIECYKNNIKDFKELLNNLGDNCLERMIHRFKGEYEINLYKDYQSLKKIAAEVKDNKAVEVFELICKQDEARAWINDNGKHKVLAFEALYQVFKSDEGLKKFAGSEENEQTSTSNIEENIKEINAEVQKEIKQEEK